MEKIIAFGKISKGCKGCFSNNLVILRFDLGAGIGLPNICNMNCTNCFDKHLIAPKYNIPPEWAITDENKTGMIKYVKSETIGKNTRDVRYTFSGSSSEPLLYVEAIEKLLRFLRFELESKTKIEGYAKIYSNGTLLNDELLENLASYKMNELRINVSASNFSEKIYQKVKLATQYIPNVTIEVPMHPLWEEQLKNMIDRLDDLGVKHLDLCQLKVRTEYGLYSLRELAKIYKTDVAGNYIVFKTPELAERLIDHYNSTPRNCSLIYCNETVLRIQENTFVKNVFKHNLTFGD
ncbi:MAG: hypothetical protein ACMUJM_17080 [bacterium]